MHPVEFCFYILKIVTPDIHICIIYSVRNSVWQKEIVRVVFTCTKIKQGSNLPASGCWYHTCRKKVSFDARSLVFIAWYSQLPDTVCYGNTGLGIRYFRDKSDFLAKSGSQYWPILCDAITFLISSRNIMKKCASIFVKYQLSTLCCFITKLWFAIGQIWLKSPNILNQTMSPCGLLKANSDWGDGHNIWTHTF